MDYYGLLKRGSKGIGVRHLQERLNQLGARLVVDGDFGARTESEVKRFQAQNTDEHGARLVVDGQVGKITWGALFGAFPVLQTPKDVLASMVLDIARAELDKNVRETSDNRSPEIDEYNKRSGAGNGADWCMSFVYWCFDEAAKKLQRDNPMLKTASCSVLYRWAKKNGFLLGENDTPDPGCILLVKGGKTGHRHTGIVESVQGGRTPSIEGNTNNRRSSHGYGIFRQEGENARKENTCDYVRFW